MRSLLSVSRRSLLRRKGRYALTALGIALGVGVVFAVLVTSAATNQAFQRFVDGFTGEADVVVTPAGTFDSLLDPDVVSAVRSDPDVDAVVERYVFRSSRELRGEDVDFRQFTQVTGLDFAEAAGVHTFVLAAGRLPETGRAEVMVTPLADAAVGETITLATSTGRRGLRVVGELSEEGAGLANGGRVVYTSIQTAQRLQGLEGAVNQVDVVLAPGARASEWVETRRAGLGEGVVAQEASDLAGFFRQFLASVQGALTITAALALFVGAFLIFLTFSVTVAERTRFFGTLRALGALPGQVRRLVLGEAVLLGALATLGGLGIGFGLAAASLGLVDSLIDVGPVSLENPWGATLLAVVLGLGTSVASSLVPARRAASLSPVAAMRDQAVDGHDRLRTAPRAALLLAGIGLTVVTDSVAIQGLGVLLMLLGAVLVVPAILHPLARALGRVTSRIGRGVGDIAVMHLVKERSRSAYTLALLMSVMAAIIAIGASNLSMSETLDEIVDRQFGSDLSVNAPNTFGGEFEQALAGVDGVGRVSEMQFGVTELIEGDRPREAFMFVIDPATYFEVSSFPWVEGDDASAARSLSRGGSVLLDDPLAEELGARVGDPVRVRTAGGPRTFTLAGTFTVLGFNGGAVFSADDARRRLGAAEPMAYLVDVAEGHDVAAVRASLQRDLGGRFDFETETTADVKAFAEDQLAGFFGIGYAVLLVAVVIGILGLANTLVVSVIQRTREIGVLRSTGVLRGQLRAMVLAESATLVLVAWLLSLPLGWLLTRVTVQAFAASLGFTVDFLWPWSFVPPLFALALFAGAVASVGPARRAARLDPVVALRFD